MTVNQEIINLFDRFTHGGMNRRTFMERLTQLAGGTAAATALLPLVGVRTVKKASLLAAPPKVKNGVEAVAHFGAATA